MSKHGRRMAGSPLSEQELQELRELATMPDAEIDCSDIPERTRLKNRTREQIAVASPSRSMSNAG
jgi:hypothetical protein